MNKLCVVAKNQETYFLRRLTEEVGILPTWNPWDKSPLPEAENYLIRTSGVYGDDRDLESLRKSQNNLINPLATHELLRDKTRQFRFLEEKGFHLIPWRQLDDRGEFLPEEILIKPIRGQGGWGIRVMEQNEFLKWETKTIDRFWIIQPYLRNVREYRLFFCGDMEIFLEREGSTIANFRQGGKARIAPLPRELEELGEEIRFHTGALYGAIDLFSYEGQHLILEINPVPGIEQLERVSGENVIRMLLKHIRSFSG